MPPMTRRQALGATAAATAASLATPALAQNEPVRIGLILPMTGPFASVGRQSDAAARAYLRANPGRRIELLLRDDTGIAPEITRRLAQELVVREKVRVLAGFGLTPLALAAAPVATEAKVPMVVTAAGTSIIPSRSPFILRTSFTLPQITVPMAEWTAKQGLRRVATLVTDFAPGLDAERSFRERLVAGGGEVVEALRVPLRNPDYAPFLQRVRDAKPEALFVFVPSGEGPALLKQFTERGLREAGVRLVCTGDVLDDDLLNDMGDPALGVVSSHHYSAAHDSDANRAFLEAFRAVAPGMRPNFMGVGAWDGMHLIAQGLQRAEGGEALVAAMAGMAWESPRGPTVIDAKTRDIVQDVHIRRVERRDGQLWNIEFDKIAQVRDPGT